MEQRFWNKVNKTDTCWLWTASLSRDGYGRFKFNGKTFGAHRISWLLAGNIIPEGHEICHASHEICGNRHCVNPAHLRVDTNAENMKDKIADGTTAKGTKNPTNILTEDQVRAIRANPENKTHRALAEQFGIRPKYISRIIHRHTWSWLN
jgi:hypothetical protein